MAEICPETEDFCDIKAPCGDFEPDVQSRASIRHFDDPHKAGRARHNNKQTMNQLAAVYLDQDRYGQAHRLWPHSLTIKETRQGHPQVAAILGQLGGPV